MDHEAPRTAALMVEGHRNPYRLPVSGVVRIGRGDGADLCFDDDLSCSRRQAEIRCSDGVFSIVPLSQTIPTLVNGHAINLPVRLRGGDAVTFGNQRAVFVLNETTAGVADGSADGRSSMFDKAQSAGKRSREKIGSAISPVTRPPNQFPLRTGVQLGRMTGPESFTLDHPSVSRQHATVTQVDGAWIIQDLGSTNGTFVNGTRLLREARLHDEDIVDIGPFSLRYLRGTLYRESRVGNMQLTGMNLTREIEKGGTKLKILSDVTVVVEPNEFACLLGPSGSGKTTLMNALSARERASSGSVYVNSIDLYDSFDLLKESMALVPQHDMLHESLTLRDALTYTARLRLPPDQTRADRTREVERAVTSVGMTHRLTARIDTLSGGQKKRASLAGETLSRPSLLFLDEVTSGLDEATDYEIMKLIRSMSESGMTTVCITHTLANVEEFCHKLVILANPGVLVFSGSPGEALEFFRVKRLSHVYRRLEESQSREWQRRFQESDLHAHHVARPVVALKQRLSGKAERPHKQTQARSIVGRGVSEAVRQFTLLSARNAKLIMNDSKTLAMAFAQAFVLGGLLAAVFAGIKSPGPLDSSYLFLTAVTAFWIGCNGASKEIVKERPIYLRERDVNLSLAAYYLSKLLINCIFVLPQVLLVFAMVLAAQVPVPVDKTLQLGYMALAGVVGTSLGLLISALSNTRDRATTLVPLALVPQIVLAGVIVPDLSEWVDLFSRTVVSAYWLNEGLMAACERCARATTSAVSSGTWAWRILVAHTLAFAAFGYLSMRFRDTRRK